jgi:flagellar export protein FliJ
VPVSRALRRLLRVLEIEEEQRRIELESGMAEAGRLNRALNAAGARERGGRSLVVSSVLTNEVRDRLSGLEETRTAQRVRAALRPKVAEAQTEVAAMRQEYMAKRTERRQAETLVEKAKAREEVELGRRTQRMLDDRFLSRFRGGASGRKAEEPSGADDVPGGTEEA